jgi:hypothetical protein
MRRRGTRERERRRGRLALSFALAGLIASGGCTEAGSGTPSPQEKRQPGVLDSSRGRDACGKPPPQAEPAPDRPRYRMDMAVDPRARDVEGRLRVRFTPDVSTDRLVFRLWPNGPRGLQEGAELDTGPVRVDGELVPRRRPNPTTLVVLLDRRLQPGDSVVAALRWSLQLPGPVHDRLSSDEDSVRLGSFFPLLAWEPGEGWLMDPPTRGLAETSTSPVADFAVRVRLPEGLEALATGERRGGRWRATAVRDFALAVGRFSTVTGVARAPEPVKVVVGVEPELQENPAHYRTDVVRALERLSALYGPYPWRTFTLAVTDNLQGSGIEYPTFVMQGSDTRGLVTTHEVAHMWFYSLVGSNPAREPWLDEGLTTYAQARVDGQVENFAAADIPAEARNRLGEGMAFWDRHPDAYFEGVYLQGVKALAALGPRRETDCGLRDYVAAHAYTIADSGDLVAELEKRIPRATEVLRRFGVDV